MKVIYSIGSKFGGHGIGGVANHAVCAIHRARALQKVLASYQNRRWRMEDGGWNGRIPNKYVKTMGVVGLGLRRLVYYDPTGWGYVLHDNIFDHWAAGQLEPGDIFHGWNHHCLRQLKGIKVLKGIKREKTITVVERASSHILQGQEILKEEYRINDINVRLLPKVYVEKCLKEYEEADYILVPSDYAKRSFLERGFAEKRIVKIPFGVDYNKLKIAVKSSKFVVLYVGEIRLGKGVQYLLEAWGKLRLKDAELWLVGEMKRDFRSIKGLKGIKDTRGVRFLGFRRDVAELMSQASVFAFPSLDEGSALVTYEAMAAGLPVVTTPNAGSLVRDSLDGYIIPIRDSEALAERLEFFYKYPEQGRRVGESGRERIAPFTWERYGEELVKAYIRMLK